MMLASSKPKSPPPSTCQPSPVSTASKTARRGSPVLSIDEIGDPTSDGVPSQIAEFTDPIVPISPTSISLASPRAKENQLSAQFAIMQKQHVELWQQCQAVAGLVKELSTSFDEFVVGAVNFQTLKDFGAFLKLTAIVTQFSNVLHNHEGRVYALENKGRRHSRTEAKLNTHVDDNITKRMEESARKAAERWCTMTRLKKIARLSAELQDMGSRAEDVMSRLSSKLNVEKESATVKMATQKTGAIVDAPSKIGGKKGKAQNSKSGDVGHRSTSKDSVSSSSSSSSASTSKSQMHTAVKPTDGAKISDTAPTSPFLATPNSVLPYPPAATTASELPSRPPSSPASSLPSPPPATSASPPQSIPPATSASVPKSPLPSFTSPSALPPPPAPSSFGEEAVNTVGAARYINTPQGLVAGAVDDSKPTTNGAIATTAAYYDRTTWPPEVTER